VPLLDDDDEGEGVTEFDLDDWSKSDLEVLQQSMNEAEIPHRWEGRTLVVASDAEHTVDDLLDAIEPATWRRSTRTQQHPTAPSTICT
jgi:hypothetical protein